MRKLATAAVILLTLAPAALTQSPADAWANKLFDGKTEHNFGTVGRGAQLKFSFPIKNIYAVPLEITGITVSCGCVTFKESKRVLQPHEEGTLDITMDPRRLPPQQQTGLKTVTIRVSVGPEYVSTATLKVTANFRGDVVFNPGEISFGVVPQGQQPVQTLDVEYTGFQDFRIKEVVKPADAPFSVTMQEMRRDAPTNRPGTVVYRMTAKLNGDAPAGSFKHELTLKTNDPNSDTLTVTADGNVQAALRVAPSLVSLGALKVNEARTFKVQVLGNKPFKITEIKSDAKDITAEMPQNALMIHTLNLTCTPTAAGELKRQITIVTDLEKNASVTVTIQGTAQ
jgi:hypothetical protein